jgi:crotonobetainyl-CoA:carnitine CoA-transferase CaiB-like acyl-CoA transferase
VRNLMCDKITAYTALQAVTAALYTREKTGEGQHIDLAMLDAGLYFLFPDAFMNETLLDDDVLTVPRLADVAYELTLTRDGAITVSAATARQQQGTLQALGLEHLMDDARFSTRENLMVHLEEYRAILAEAFGSIATEEILARLHAADVPAAKCLDLPEVLAHAQLAANGTIEVGEHPRMGTMRIVRLPAEFGGRRLPAASPAPAHGEHTDQVLAGLGLDADRIAGYRQKGVVA